MARRLLSDLNVCGDMHEQPSGSSSRGDEYSSNSGSNDTGSGAESNGELGDVGGAGLIGVRGVCFS